MDAQEFGYLVEFFMGKLPVAARYEGVVELNDDFVHGFISCAIWSLVSDGTIQPEEVPPIQNLFEQDVRRAIAEARSRLGYA